MLPTLSVNALSESQNTPLSYGAPKLDTQKEGDILIEYLNRVLSNERLLFVPFIRSFFKFDTGLESQKDKSHK